MPFHRFDSSADTRETVRRAAKQLTNALRGISDRLNAISIGRLNAEHHHLPQLFGTARAAFTAAPRSRFRINPPYL